MKIVVDAMGGDHAPGAVIAGVVEAIQELEIDIALIGRKEIIEKELRRINFSHEKLEIIHAPDVVGMHEPATVSLRKKKNSSISLGVELLKNPSYDAFISAGNTGAVVAASTINLGMLEGVERPAIGLMIPTLKEFSFIIDVGANAEAKPKHLLQSALMARVYAKEVLGIDNPSVGLLNIGEEAGKGGDFVKESYDLLYNRIPNFIGNIEASEVYTGKSDCIICDGFVGNVVLKVSESLVESAGKLIKREVKKNPLAIVGAVLMKAGLSHIKRLTDYSEYGSAPLLGVNGLVMISHGRSNAKAIKNAIKSAMREVEHNIIERMIKEVSS